MSAISDDEDSSGQSSLNSSDQFSVSEERNKSALTILDGKFFKKESEKSSGKSTIVTGTCVKCLPKVVKINGLANTTSNFLSHLKRKHGEDAIAEYRKHSADQKQKRCRVQDNTTEVNDSRSTRTINQTGFENDVTNFFVHSMIPLNVVEDPYFATMLNNLELEKHKLNLISRRTLCRRITESHLKDKSQTKLQLENTEHVCTVVDIWSCRRRSFFGMTVHWLDSDLNRQSKTLACRRFAGVHNFERIAMLLEELHTDFGLTPDKIVATVTDNGSNFVKAFKEFGLSVKLIECFDSDSEEENAEEENAEEDFVEHTNELNIVLPSHRRCTAHTLNLCAVTDANRLLKKNNQTTLSELHHKTIDKCNILWNAAGRPKTAEIIQETLGHTLSKPGVTRWNSLYDAMKQIYSIKEKNILLHRALGLDNFITDREFEYIKEYIICSAPIAEALDILQGEKNMYYGLLVPCLMSLRKKLRKLQNFTLRYCRELIQCYVDSVEKRFEEFFNFSSGVSEHATIAALSYPRFKNKWFSCITPQDQEKVKSIFKHVIAMEISKQTDIIETDEHTTDPENPFFDFGSDSDSEIDAQVQEVPQRNTPRTKAEILMGQFFAERDKSLIVLNRYEIIKTIFKKYNTPLPSSASVERVFSYATMMNLPKSNRLSDHLFEERVVLKTNLKSKNML